jgi:hypothetical protein
MPGGAIAIPPTAATQRQEPEPFIRHGWMIAGLSLMIAGLTFVLYIISLFLPRFSGTFDILMRIAGFTTGGLFALFCIFALGMALVRVVGAMRDELEQVRAMRRK